MVKAPRFPRAAPWLSVASWLAPRGIWALTLLVCSAGLVVTWGSALRQRDLNEQLVQQRLKEVADDSVETLEAHAKGVTRALRGARGYFIGAGTAGASEQGFAAYWRSRGSLSEEFPGVAALGFLRRVPQADKAAYEARQRLADPEYRIREFGVNHGDAYVVDFLHPGDLRSSARGLDMGSEAVRRVAMDEAIRQNEPIMTSPELFARAGLMVVKGASVVYLPIFQQGPQLRGDLREGQSVFGVVGAIFLSQPLLENLLPRQSHVFLKVEDISPDIERTDFTFYQSEAADVAPTISPVIVSRTILGRQWRMTFSPGRQFADSLQLLKPGQVLLTGVLASGGAAVFAFVGLNALGRRRADRLAGQSARALTRSKRDLQTVIDLLPSGLAYFDPKGECRYANLTYHREVAQTGTTLQAWMDRVLGTSPTALERGRLALEAVLNGDRRTHEEELGSAEGASRTLLYQLVPDLDEDSVVGFYLTFSDVSTLAEQRRLLAAAMKEKAMLVETMHAFALFSSTDVQGRILEVNDRLCRLSGYSREQLVGATHRLMSSRRHPPSFWSEMWAVLLAGRPWHGQMCNRSSTGSLFWLDSVVVPSFATDGTLSGFTCIGVDITAMRLADERLAQREALLRRTGRIARVGGWQLDLAREEMTWSEEVKSLLEVDEDQQPSLETTLRFYPPGARTVLEKSIRHAALSGDGWNLTLPLRTARGRDLWVESQGEAEYVEGKLARLVGTLRDVTEQYRMDQERKEAHARLQQAIERADAASAAKSEFLANMSHEIRTPLNAVVGLAYLMERQDLTAESRTLAARIRAAGNALAAIISDVLDVSKIEAGQMSLELTATDLHQTIESAVQLITAQAEDKGLQVRTGMSPSVPRWVLADATRITQIASNLLGNALKFTSHGSIELLTTAQPLPNDEVRLWLSVRDTGLGIASELQGKLFSPFVQADASTTRKFGGTGLGLSIVKRLAEMMGGTVSLASTQGRGSTFVVELVVKALPAHVPVPEQFPDVAEDQMGLPGVRILLVDDSDLNREVGESLLRLEGAAVEVCDDGSQAVELLTRRADEFDAVLMDMQMPVMDGCQATRALRARADLQDLPIIAVTAGALQSERAKALNAGMNGFLTKPLAPKELVRVLRECVAKYRGAPVPVQTRSREAAPRLSNLPALAALDLSNVAAPVKDDPARLQSMLRRLLAEFEDLAQDSALAELLEQRDATAARAHKLRGSAAIVGARRVASAAIAVEKGFRREASLASDKELLCELARELDLLRVSCAEFLAKPLTPAAVQPSGPAEAAPPTAEEVARLLQLLGQQNMGALSCYRVQEEALLSMLGPDDAAALRLAMEDLDFSRACELLSRHAAPAVPLPATPAPNDRR